jgi:hypothetical protein
MSTRSHVLFYDRTIELGIYRSIISYWIVLAGLSQLVIFFVCKVTVLAMDVFNQLLKIIITSCFGCECHAGEPFAAYISGFSIVATRFTGH